MRFLLKYGLFENNGNEYYYQISNEEYRDFRSDDLNKTFDEDEILKIKKLFPENIYVGLAKRYASDYTNIYAELKDRAKLNILKADDEWYYLYYYHRFREDDITSEYDNFFGGNFREDYFKCDQFEGLKSFIEDMLNSKINFKN